MSLADRIKDDMKVAMRERDKDRLGTIRLILAAIKQQEKDLEMQRKENERLKAEAEAERRELGEQAAAKAKARRKGGFRMLLSQARMGAAKDEGMQQKLGGDSQQV